MEGITQATIDNIQGIEDVRDLAFRIEPSTVSGTPALTVDATFFIRDVARRGRGILLREDQTARQLIALSDPQDEQAWCAVEPMLHSVQPPTGLMGKRTIDNVGSGAAILERRGDRWVVRHTQTEGRPHRPSDPV